MPRTNSIASWIITSIGLAVFAYPAAAASKQDWRDCQAADPERSIAGCTRIVLAPHEFAENRGIAYYNRGIAWYDKGNLDRAIEDYTRAMGFEPQLTSAYINRGIAFRAKGERELALSDYNEAIHQEPTAPDGYKTRGDIWLEKNEADRAIADYMEAIRLNPNDADAYKYLGYAEFAVGRFGTAAEHFGRSVAVKENTYAVLFHYVALARGGSRTTEELQSSATRLKIATHDWPYPVLKFFLSRSSLEDMFAAASNQRERCAAEFFAGEWYLLQGDLMNARSAFQSSVETCPTTSTEYNVAIAELRRLD